MLNRLSALWWLVPATAVGLFVGRIASEWLRPGLPGAIGLTALATLAAVWLLRQRPFPSLLLLLLYVAHPNPDPRAAATAVALAGLAWVIGRGMGRPPRVPAWPPATAVALAALALYLQTLAPGVLPADSGEFQLVAAQLGVAHPPGFPLYTLLAHLFTWLPLGPSAAWRVNLFAAATAASTLFVVYLTAHRLTRSHLTGLTAAVSLATSTTFWAQATTANIRGLTALFAALVFYALVRWRQEEIELEETTSSATIPQSAIHNSQFTIHDPQSWLVLAVLALSFGVTHHPSLAFMGGVFGLFVLVVRPSLLRTPRRWPSLLLAALAGLLPLLYLPWRAAAGARGAGGLNTLDGFLDHVLARGFSGDFFYFVEPSVLWPRLRVMGNVLTFQFSPWLLAGMAIGFLLLLRRDRKLAFLLGGAFAIHTLVTAVYRAPQTVEYMLPAYLPLVLMLGYGVGAAVGPIPRLTPFRRWTAAALVAGVLVTAVWQGIARYPSYASLAASTDAGVYAQNLLDDAPPDSVILAHWHWVTPLWYLHEVDGQRPDVAINYVFPTAERYEATWTRRTAEALADGRPVVATHFSPSTADALPPPEPLGEAFLYRQEPLTSLPPGFQPLDGRLGEQIELLGYRLETTAVAIGDEAALTLAWRPAADFTAPATLFAHLVSPDGVLVAQDDVPARSQPDGLTLTRFQLTPRPGAGTGDFSIQVGVYGGTRTAVASLAVLPSPWPPFSHNPTWRPNRDDGRVLVGCDWDHTLSGPPRLYRHWRTAAGYVSDVHDIAEFGAVDWPVSIGPWGLPRPISVCGGRNEQYVPLGGGIVWIGGTGMPRSPEPGQQLTLAQGFRSSRPVNRDLIVSARLIGFEEDRFHWAWWDLADGVPALGAIPTLKWIGGSAVDDPHFVTVSQTAVPGQMVGGTVQLYDAFTGRPLPILDERILERPLPLIPLAPATVAAP